MIKKIIVCIAIVLLFVLLLAFAQEVLAPKYVSDGQPREGALIGEYYREVPYHDVLFVGDCEVYESFTPPTLWEEYGITSYIRGSAQQLIWQSYYLLEETLEYETPDVVVFNVLAMKYGEPQKEEYNRMTLDGMRWSASKFHAIQASMTSEESLISYLFPLLRYHSRWKELSAEDFQYLSKRSRPTVSHNGYLMQTGVSPKTSDREGLPLADYTLPQICFFYLDKMRTLCEERGIELILIKAPTNSWKYYWYEEWDMQIADYAKENGVDYYNFISLENEIGLDWSTDTYDGGVHLNVFGAEKLTSYFGALLAEKYGVQNRWQEDTLSAIWQKKLTLYQKEKNRGNQ